MTFELHTSIHSNYSISLHHLQTSPHPQSHRHAPPTTDTLSLHSSLIDGVCPYLSLVNLINLHSKLPIGLPSSQTSNAFKTIHLLFITNSPAILLVTRSLVSFDLFLSSIIDQSSSPSNVFSLWPKSISCHLSICLYIH